MMKNNQLFQYHPQLNSQHLEKLYHNDYLLAAAVFADFCTDCANYIPRIKLLQQDGTLGEITDFLHKIGPSYSYVGLPGFAAEINDFILFCQDLQPDAGVNRLLNALLTYMAHWHGIIALQATALKEHIRHAG
jgi:hypothetical protein